MAKRKKPTPMEIFDKRISKGLRKRKIAIWYTPHTPDLFKWKKTGKQRQTASAGKDEEQGKHI